MLEFNNYVDTGVQGGVKWNTDSTITLKETRGCLKDAVVTSEEVIEANLKPVTELINKTSQQLKIIMKALLRSYSSSKNKTLELHFHLFPFKNLCLPLQM